MARNVALNANCTSSLGDDRERGEMPCHWALDGVVDPSHGWITASSTGSWMRINFDDVYRITSVRLTQLIGDYRGIQYIEILFRDNVRRTVSRLSFEGRRC